MGRPRQRKAPREESRRIGRSTKGKRGSRASVTVEELEDDIDKFHKGLSKIPMDVNDDPVMSSRRVEDEIEEEPVFDLKAGSSGEDDAEGSDDDDDDLDEEELTGLAAKMAKQAKFMRRKTSLMEEDEDEDEDEDEEAEKRAPWGKRKRMYYSADNVDYMIQSSDEEAPAEEEAEALRLQRQIAESLRPEDFDLAEDDEIAENERTLQEVVERVEAKSNEDTKILMPKRGHIRASNEDAHILVEEVKKDISALSKEEQMNVVMSDAPELVGLLAELREASDELHKKIEPLLLKVKECGTGSPEGFRYLETKRMLLLCYLQSILFYLLMKAEGHSVRDHPVIARLVEIRTLLQKLEPLDKKLQSQVDKLTTLLVEGPHAEKKELNVSEKSLKGLLLETKENLLKDHERALHKRKSVEKSPVKEVKEVAALLKHTGARMRTNKPRTREQSDEDDDAVPNKKSSLHRVISTNLQKRKPMQLISGDMDVPLKEELGERRAKIERQRRVHDVNNMDDDLKEQQEFIDNPEEDNFYLEAKRLKGAKQAAKAAAKSSNVTIEELAVEDEAVAVGKRHITYQMEKNKGLTPHRKKLTKNPRKKYKLKHQKAVIRRKGQVREVRQPTGPYGGEATGIRTAISRSVRFQS